MLQSSNKPFAALGLDQLHLFVLFFCSSSCPVLDRSYASETESFFGFRRLGPGYSLFSHSVGSV